MLNIKSVLARIYLSNKKMIQAKGQNTAKN